MFKKLRSILRKSPDENGLPEGHIVLSMLKYSLSIFVIFIFLIAFLGIFFFNKYTLSPQFNSISVIVSSIFLGGLIGLFMRPNIAEFRSLFEKDTKDSNLLDDDALYSYLNKSVHKFSPDILKQLNTWKTSKDAKFRDNLFKKITSQMDIEIKSFQEKPLDELSETSYLNIIGAMLVIMQNKVKTDQQKSLFGGQTAIIKTLLEEFDGLYGISQSNLDKKFSKANQNLKSNHFN
jgi:energy-coupling factor transporter transmembrane protein EcfT